MSRSSRSIQGWHPTDAGGSCSGAPTQSEARWQRGLQICIRVRCLWCSFWFSNLVWELYKLDCGFIGDVLSNHPISPRISGTLSILNQLTSHRDGYPLGKLPGGNLWQFLQGLGGKGLHSSVEYYQKSPSASQALMCGTILFDFCM
jgi:hypothetical protein